MKLGLRRRSSTVCSSRGRRRRTTDASSLSGSPPPPARNRGAGLRRFAVKRLRRRGTSSTPTRTATGAGEALLETGVTAYVPTLITTPEHQLIAAMAEVPGRVAAADPRMHLEGHFFSPNDLGRTRPPHAASRLAMLDRLLAAGPVA